MGTQLLACTARTLSNPVVSWFSEFHCRDANKRADQLSNVAMDGNGWTGFKDSQVLLLCLSHVWHDEGSMTSIVT